MMKNLTIYLILAFVVLNYPGIASEKVIATYGNNQKITREQILWHSQLTKSMFLDILDAYTLATTQTQKNNLLPAVEQEIKNYLAISQLGENALQHNYLERYPFNKYYQLMRQDYLDGLWYSQQNQVPINLSYAEISTYYSSHSPDFVVPTQWEIRSIYLQYKSDSSDQNLQYDRLSSICFTVTTGASFANMARNYSESENAIRGGNLGLINPAKFKSPIKETIEKLHKGQVSPIINLGKGWMVFYCENVQPGNTLTLSANYSSISAKIVESLRTRQIQDKIKSLWNNSTTKTNLELVEASTPDTTIIAVVNQKPVFLYDLVNINPGVVHLNLDKKLDVLKNAMNNELIAQEAQNNHLITPTDQWKINYIANNLVTETYLQDSIARNYHLSNEQLHNYYQKHQAQFKTSETKHTYLITIPYASAGNHYRNRTESITAAQEIQTCFRSNPSVDSSFQSYLAGKGCTLVDMGNISSLDSQLAYREWITLKSKSISKVIEGNKALQLLCTQEIISGEAIPFEQVKGKIKQVLINEKSNQVYESCKDQIYNQAKVKVTL